MKKSNKITLCAILAALATVVMMAAYFPYVTYSVPAIAGLFIMAALIETDKKWAFACYLVSVVPIMLFAESEAKFIYICFFGFYPILKCILEKIKNNILCFIVKIICFNGLMAICYLLLKFVTGITFTEADTTKLILAATVILFNAVFILYDILLAKLASEYLVRIHPFVKKILYKK